MNYNAITDVAILGTCIIGLAAAIIIIGSRKPKPTHYHMLDQAKRWGYK